MTKIEKAMSFAAHRHTGQMYGEHPYVKHLQDVYELACKFNLSENVKAAAWLHDVLEGTQTFTFELEEQFGSEIADIVYAVTGYGDNRKQRNADAMRKILKNKEAARLKLCDRIANILECEKTDKEKLKMYLKEHEDFSHVPYLLDYEDRAVTQFYYDLITRLIIDMTGQILKHLIENGPSSPTQIGLGLGYSYNNASSAINPRLKKLVQSAMVERIKVNGRVKYKAL